MEQQLQKLTQAILARGELLEQLQNQYAAIQASVEEMKPIRPEVKTETKPAEPVVSDPLLRAEVPQSVTPPAQASSSRSLATGELDALMPTGCSMNCPNDDTNSRTSAFMPDATPGPPSTAALLDVASTSPEPTDATILVRDDTGELTPTPSGTAVHPVDLGDEHVPNLSNYQLGARKVFDRMCGTGGVSYGFSTNGLVLTTCCPDESSSIGIAVVDRATCQRERAHRVLILARLENSCEALEFRQPWPPPTQVDVTYRGLEYGDAAIAADLSGAQVPFQVPLEVNVVLIGFNGDGGYRYSLDGHKLEQFLKRSFPLHRPSCFETGEPIDIESHIMYNVIVAGQPEQISLEKSLKEAMVPAGTARESEYGREFPLFEVEATTVEPILERLYSFILDMEPGYSAKEMDRPVPEEEIAFISQSATNYINLAQVHEAENAKSFEYANYVTDLSVFVLSSQFNAVNLPEFNLFKGGIPKSVTALPKLKVLWAPKAGLEGNVPSNWGRCHSLRMVNLAQNLLSGVIPRELGQCSNLKFLNLSSNRLSGSLGNDLYPHYMAVFDVSGNELSGSIPAFANKGCSSQLMLDDMQSNYSSLVMSETVAELLLGYCDSGECSVVYHNFAKNNFGGFISTTIEHVIAPDVRFETIDMTVRLLIPIIVLQNHNRYNILQAGHNYSIDVQAIEREVKKMVHTGSHALHQHEKLAVAVSKAMRSHSLHETKTDGRFHVRTKTYLDGAILKEEMERSADVLSAGLLEVSDPSLSSRFFLKQHWMDEQDDAQDSIKHRPIWESYMPRNRKEKRGTGKKKHGNLYRTYGTRVIQVLVLSLAGVDAELLMEGESLVWTGKERHILAGLASAAGGLSAPYERASHIHDRPIVNWLWAARCHPFGPFSNYTQISQIFQDVAALSACSHSGLVQEGKFYLNDECHYFHQMISRYKLEPQLEYSACMVDLCCLCVLEQHKHGGDCIQVRLGMEVLLVPWDPGGNGDDSFASAWGQAAFQGGRNVTDRPGPGLVWVSLVGCGPGGKWYSESGLQRAKTSTEESIKETNNRLAPSSSFGLLHPHCCSSPIPTAALPQSLSLNSRIPNCYSQASF